jgi:hypothetical protein
MRVFSLRSRPWRELTLFALSLGALTYLSQTERWTWFAILFAVCVVLFAIDQRLSYRPVDEQLDELERRQYRLKRRFEEFGLVDVFNMQVPEQQDERNRATRDILTSGNTFALLTNTAASYIDPNLHRHWNPLRARLEQGATLRLLLLSPFSPEKRLRDELNAVGPPPDSKLSLAALISLHNDYPTAHVRFSPHAIYSAVFFSESDMIWDPYHLGKVGDRIENHFIALQLRRSRVAPGTPYFEILRSHFEALWARSEDIETFLANHSNALLGTAAQQLPAIVSRRGLPTPEGPS